jgi:arginine decarboxylase
MARQQICIDQFFAEPGARADRWRDIVDAAQAWSSGRGDRVKFNDALSAIGVTEEYFAYPGPRLIKALQEATAANDARATLNIAQGTGETLYIDSGYHIID